MNNEFKIDLSSELEQNLAETLFGDQRLFASFAAHLGINVGKYNPKKNTVSFVGEKSDEGRTKAAFSILLSAFATNGTINKDIIKNAAYQVKPQEEEVVLTPKFNKKGGGSKKKIANDNSHKPREFKPKNEKQQLQSDLIDADENDVIFSIGPAGTGKTHVAMVKAVEALKAGKISKIVLTRPAIEAAENLGFLPGDLIEKLGPYMRPLYDELDKAFGIGAYKQMIEDGIIEVCPVGFMRGRTFEDCYVILDEAQNCEYEHLTMAVSRIGQGCKMLITGDPDQSDLGPGVSGLKPMADDLLGVEGVAHMEYDAADIIRHPTVKRIIERLKEKEAQRPKTQPAQRAKARGR